MVLRAAPPADGVFVVSIKDVTERARVLAERLGFEPDELEVELEDGSDGGGVWLKKDPDSEPELLISLEDAGDGKVISTRDPRDFRDFMDAKRQFTRSELLRIVSRIDESAENSMPDILEELEKRGK